MSDQMRIRPPDGQAAIGIDLGTSSSLVAVWTSVTGTIPEVRNDLRFFYVSLSLSLKFDFEIYDSLSMTM